MSGTQEDPLSYQNWKAQQEDKPRQRTFEYPCYTNAHLIGEIDAGLGPYQLINTVSLGSGRPSLILRIENYLEFKTPPMETKQNEYYHGGTEADEIAALVSICLGIQLKAGDATRIFSSENDRWGTPIGSSMSPDPHPRDASPQRGRPILKNVLGDHDLLEARVISTLPDLTPENIGALIRAARMYQEAVWIVENSPELSWLLLTSAIETVADLWYDKGHDTVDVIDVMRASYPKLEKILRKYGQSKADELIQEVARVTFKRSLARRKFVEFIIQFLPPPPAIRPAPFAQISWELADMKKIFKKIYDYRSQALHGGKPFPAPMCMPPSPLGKEGVLEEQPHALAMRVKGSVWVAEELPIYLNTFEYIVRNAILNWWKSLVEE